MSYENLIDHNPYVKCSAVTKEDLFRPSKDQQLNLNDAQNQEEYDDLSDKEEFKYVKNVIKKGKNFKF